VTGSLPTVIPRYLRNITHTHARNNNIVSCESISTDFALTHTCLRVRVNAVVHSTDNMNARMQVGRMSYGAYYAEPEEIIAMREGHELIEQDDGFMVPLFKNGDIVEVDEHNYKELWYIMQVDGYDPLLYTWRDLPNVGGSHG
jgi:hypothetical protein